MKSPLSITLSFEPETLLVSLGSITCWLQFCPSREINTEEIFTHRPVWGNYIINWEGRNEENCIVWPSKLYISIWCNASYLFYMNTYRHWPKQHSIEILGLVFGILCVFVRDMPMCTNLLYKFLDEIKLMQNQLSLISNKFFVFI